MTFQNWKEVIDVNLTGTFLITKSVSEIMKNEKSGRIIFISSIAGEEIGYPGLSHYSASKAGMNGFMRSAALELAPHKITVNSIDPGNIMNTESFPVDEKAMANMLRRIPLGRLGQPLDVANIALFLASDELILQYFNGHFEEKSQIVAAIVFQKPLVKHSPMSNVSVDDYKTLLHIQKCYV